MADTLRKRVLTAVVLAAVALAVLLWLPPVGHGRGDNRAGARRRLGVVRVPHGRQRAPGGRRMCC